MRENQGLPVDESDGESITRVHLPLLIPSEAKGEDKITPSKGITLLWNDVEASHPDLDKALKAENSGDYSLAVKTYIKLAEKIHSYPTIEYFALVAERSNFLIELQFDADNLKEKFKNIVTATRDTVLTELKITEDVFDKNILELSKSFNIIKEFIGIKKDEGESESKNNSQLLIPCLELFGRILTKIGYCFMCQNDWLSAKQYLEKCLIIYPLYPYTFINLADMDINDGMYAKAKEKFEKASVLSKEFNYLRSEACVNLNRGELYMLLTDWKEVQYDPAFIDEETTSLDSVEMKKIAKEFMEKAKTDYSRLEEEFKQGQWNEFENEIKRNQLNNRGNLYRIEKNYDEAIKAYTEAIPSVNNVSLFYLRGIAYGFNQQFNEAFDDLRKAIHEGVSNPLIYIQYVRILKNYLLSLGSDEAKIGQATQRLSQILDRSGKDIEKIFRFILDKIHDGYGLSINNDMIIVSIQSLLEDTVERYPHLKEKLIENLKNKLRSPVVYNDSQQTFIARFLKRLNVKDTEIRQLIDHGYEYSHEAKLASEIRRREWCMFITNLVVTLVVTGGSFVVAALAYKKDSHSSNSSGDGSPIRNVTTLFNPLTARLISNFTSNFTSNFSP